jgi:hypothetical protein
MSGANQRGFCPVCRSLYALRKDGMVRVHERLVIAYNYGARDHREPCPGSGRPAAKL